MLSRRVAGSEATYPARVHLVSRKQPNRFAAFANSPKVAAWFVGLVAVACGVGAFAAYDAATSLRDHGQRVVGAVVEVNDGGRGNYVVVRFVDTNGQVVAAEVGNYRWDPKPKVGDQPEIVYDPEDPSGNVADVRMGPDFFSVWALGIGGLLAAGLVWPTWTGRLDWDKLRR
jgi:hypothetical protein